MEGVASNTKVDDHDTLRWQGKITGILQDRELHFSFSFGDFRNTRTPFIVSDSSPAGFQLRFRIILAP